MTDTTYTEESTLTIETVTSTDTETTVRPIPGLDIINVVHAEAVGRAKAGQPPAYCFLRVDIYLILVGTNATSSITHWLDTSIGLDCYLLPLLPGEGQSPFILASTYEEARGVQIGSFPTGTFVEEATPDNVESVSS